MCCWLILVFEWLVEYIIAGADITAMMRVSWSFHGREGGRRIHAGLEVQQSRRQNVSRDTADILRGSPIVDHVRS